VAFILLEVPDPVWNTSSGNSASCWFAATLPAAFVIASAVVLVQDAELGVRLGGGSLISPSAAINSG
jgi:hypothetical protein